MYLQGGDICRLTKGYDLDAIIEDDFFFKFYDEFLLILWFFTVTHRSGKVP